MKKTRVLILIIFFLVSASIGVLAADSIRKVEAFIRSDFQVFLDGEKTEISPVLLYENRSYLPLRQVAELVGADVIWNDDNKGIYINQRYPGQPVRNTDENQRYELMNLFQPMAYEAAYLGGDYSLLTNTTYDYKVYYREKDLNYMGMDTRGLLKVREPLTDQLYIDKEEVSTLWKETPMLRVVYDSTKILEYDEEKAQIIKDFVEHIPLREAVLRGEELQPNRYYDPPIVYTIDVLPDDEYNILTYQDITFAWYTIKLQKNKDGKWFQRQYSKSSQELILN